MSRTEDTAVASSRPMQERVKGDEGLLTVTFDRCGGGGDGFRPHAATRRSGAVHRATDSPAGDVVLAAQVHHTAPEENHRQGTEPTRQAGERLCY